MRRAVMRAVVARAVHGGRDGVSRCPAPPRPDWSLLRLSAVAFAFAAVNKFRRGLGEAFVMLETRCRPHNAGATPPRVRSGRLRYPLLCVQVGPATSGQFGRKAPVVGKRGHSAPPHMLSTPAPPLQAMPPPLPSPQRHVVFSRPPPPCARQSCSRSCVALAHPASAHRRR